MIIKNDTMRHLLYTILLLLPGGVVFSQNFLDSCLNIAAENNPALNAAFNKYYAALEKIPQAKALPDPTVAFGYFIMPVETKNGPQQAKISVSQMLPWFGTLKARRNVAEMNAKAEYETFEEQKSKLFYDVKSSYYKLFFTREAIVITRENLKLLSTFMNMARIKVEAGSASSADLYGAEMEFNDAENRLALLKDQFRVQQVLFNKLLNVPSEQIVVLPDSLDVTLAELSKDSFLDSVRMNNNALAASDYRLDALHCKATVTEKEGMPGFSAGLDYSFIGSGTSTSADAGQDAFMFPKIGVVIPLYRNKYKAMANEVRFETAAQEFEKENKVNMLESLFETAWNDYQDALRRRTFYMKQTDAARKSLSVLETDYMSNNRDFEDVLKMERRLLEFKLELQKALVDELTAVAFMEYLRGG